MASDERGVSPFEQVADGPVTRLAGMVLWKNSVVTEAPGADASVGGLSVLRIPSGAVVPVCYTDVMDAPFGQVIGSLDELRRHYRQPATTVRSSRKKVGALDPLAREFVAASPFVLLGTADGAGRLDVSPWGGPAGFVKTLDDRRLVLPDLNGNNLLDSFENVVVNPFAACCVSCPAVTRRCG